MKHIKVFENFQLNEGLRVTIVTLGVNFDSGSKERGVEGSQEKFETFLTDQGIEYDSSGGANVTIEVDIIGKQLAQIISMLKELGIENATIDF